MTITLETISLEVREVLAAEYQSTIDYQLRKNRVTVEITFAQYVSLWTPARIATIQRKLNGRNGDIQRYLRDSVYGPCCTWRAKSDLVVGGTMTVHNARIASREDSRRLFQFTTGDTHNALSKSRIGASKKGVAQSRGHVEKRAAKMRGVSQGPCSDARRDAIRDGIARRKAEKADAR